MIGILAGQEGPGQQLRKLCHKHGVSDATRGRAKSSGSPIPAATNSKASAPIELCLEMAEFVLPGYVRMWRDAGSAAAAFNGRDYKR
jgi:hypothetical protein